MYGYQHIHCIPPPSSACERELLILEFLGKVVSTSKMQQKIESCYRQIDESGQVIDYGVTAINADRYMISIPADRHDVEDKEFPLTRAIRCVFDGIIEAWEARKLSDVPLITEIWDRITRFSITQAYTDLVYSRDIKVPYTFGTLSLIVSFGRSISQNPHVDMVHPNFQFSIVTQKGFFKGTHEYQVDEDKIISCSDDLFDNEHGVQAWKEAIPDEETRQLVKESKLSQHLLANFGCVLADSVQQVDDQKADKPAECLYPIGTCLTLPGSIIHAGPACDKTRCIVFSQLLLNTIHRCMMLTHNITVPHLLLA
jgi:hypothetical protein